MCRLHAAYHAGGGAHPVLSVAVRKSDLLRDDGNDWTHHCITKGGCPFAANRFGKDAIREQAVTATFILIEKVGDPVSTVTSETVLYIECSG